MGGAQAGVWSKLRLFRPQASALGSNTLCALRRGGCERSVTALPVTPNQTLHYYVLTLVTVM
jgi:hypothetical protein